MDLLGIVACVTAGVLGNALIGWTEAAMDRRTFEPKGSLKLGCVWCGVKTDMGVCERCLADRLERRSAGGQETSTGVRG
jgi:hypothetical protein